MGDTCATGRRSAHLVVAVVVVAVTFPVCLMWNLDQRGTRASVRPSETAAKSHPAPACVIVPAYVVRGARSFGASHERERRVQEQDRSLLEPFFEAERKNVERVQRDGIRWVAKKCKQAGLSSTVFRRYDFDHILSAIDAAAR
jgi:hypothetical protein